MTSETENQQATRVRTTVTGGFQDPARFLVDVLPEIRRPGVGPVLISEWDAEDTARQQAVIEGAARALGAAPLPDGLVSQVFLAGTDGRTVLGLGQWEEGAAGAPLRAVEEGGARPYRYYRSLLPQGEPPEPGCIVTVRFRTTGHEAARQLVDGLVDMMNGLQPGAADRSRTLSGGISSNFHISEDGTRVFNYSEWTDEAAHQRVVDTSLQQGGAVMRFIESVPGVTPLGFKRYVAPRGLVRR
ncbi:MULTISPECIES: antibiotic biosynthesis monooxygenase [Streptomyces]|uniref:antibiotic biosynthesis monooxygenase n=1 Tax=Streptomyces TaxID=1883 RepID=UPI00067C7CFD|nr:MULTISPECIES: antibiotic biosynthesis monooxygenase [Streptomyces]